jgi:hypothetical protein
MSGLQGFVASVIPGGIDVVVVVFVVIIIWRTSSEKVDHEPYVIRRKIINSMSLRESED